MEPSFMILGGDGKQYGPVSAQQFSAWAREGRVNGDTQVRTQDSETWVAAATVPELGAAPTPAVATMAPPASAPAGFVGTTSDPAVDQRIKSGVSWFYWIAGLSVVNSILAVSGADWRFFFGPGITQVLDQVALQIGGPAGIVALVFNAIVAAIFVGLGIFAGKRHSWAFIVGLVLIALDGLLTASYRDWISTAFHAFVLFVLFRTYQVHRSAA